MTSALGDAVGPHLLICGRCEPILAGLEAASYDVVCTSPPYNLRIPYATHADDMPEEVYLDWFAGIARDIARLMRPSASFFLNLGGSSSRPWLPFSLPMRLRSLTENGKPLFVLQNHIQWVKSITVGDTTRGQFKPLNSPRFLNHTHETLLHFTLDGAVPLDRLAIGVPYADSSNLRRFGASGRANLRCRGNSWFIPYETVQSREEKFHHPASFPLTLPRWCLRLHGKAHPDVLDPFSGVGTVAVAAQMEGGTATGIELDPTYHDVAVTRLRQTITTFKEAL